MKGEQASEAKRSSLFRPWGSEEAEKQTCMSIACTSVSLALDQSMTDTRDGTYDQVS